MQLQLAEGISNGLLGERGGGGSTTASNTNYLELNMAPDLVAAANTLPLSPDTTDGHLWPCLRAAAAAAADAGAASGATCRSRSRSRSSTCCCC